MGKGEIARYEQFLLFPQCFQKACFPGVSKCVIVREWVNPLPDDKILDRSNLKQSAEDNLKFDENSRKFSKRVENIVGKGEIARYEQFLLFPQCFQKASFLGASKGVIEWEWVKANVLPKISAIEDRILKIDLKREIKMFTKHYSFLSMFTPFQRQPVSRDFI